MTGYDAIQGDPLSSLTDPGVRARIFLHDCEDGYYDFVSDVRNSLQCDSDFSMQTIDSMDAYESERQESNSFEAGASLSVSGGFAGIEASASASYNRATNSDSQASEKVLNKYNGEITRAKATCLTHTVSIADKVRPLFTTNFINHLEALDAASGLENEEEQKQVVSEFIKEFGTHFSKVTKLGAELIFERRFESTARTVEQKKARNGCVKDEASLSLGVSTPSVEVSGEASFSNEDCKSVNEGSDFSNSEGFEAVKTVSRGSRPTEISDWTGSDFVPVPIKRTLKDISTLFQNEWMTKSEAYGFEKDLSGSKIAAMYTKYIENYCSLMLYGILDDNCEGIGKLNKLT